MVIGQAGCRPTRPRCMFPPMTEEQPRRLSAVMFTDVVGYTAIMQEDEEAARVVRLRHREALEAAIAAHGENSFSTSATGVSARSQVP